MLRFIAVISSILGVSAAWAQTDCREAAQALKKELLKTTSAKAQLKGRARDAYNHIYNEVVAATTEIKDTAGCFTLLTRLVEPLRDNHLFFSEKADVVLEGSELTDSNWISRYRSSPAFINFPSLDINLDSLSERLEKKPPQSAEGVYYQQRYQRIGVFQYPGSDTMYGVVLETYLPNWDTGHLLFKLWQEEPGRYAAISSNMLQKTLEYQRHIRFVNGDIPLLNLVRDISATNHANIAPDKPLFDFKTLDPYTDYIRLGSFAVNNIITPQAKTFLKRIKDSLNADNLIVDLRNNGGGGFVTSRPFLKLIKKHARKHRVLLLMNYHTISNAEQVVIRLKKRKNIHTLGQPTRGMITYGSNYGNHAPVAGSSFRLYGTDMKGHKKDLRYEDKGVTPAIILDSSKDWIEQTLAYIQSLASS